MTGTPSGKTKNSLTVSPPPGNNLPTPVDADTIDPDAIAESLYANAMMQLQQRQAEGKNADPSRTIETALGSLKLRLEIEARKRRLAMGEGVVLPSELRDVAEQLIRAFAESIEVVTGKNGIDDPHEFSISVFELVDIDQIIRDNTTEAPNGA